MDIKKIVANNLIMYRKKAKLTQQELADILNYTDKAISKWERAEAMPDIVVLKQLADMYGIKVDDLLIEHEEPVEIYQNEVQKLYTKKHILVALLSAGLVWLIATIIVVIVGIVLPDFEIAKYTYITALPFFFIVLLVFNSIWGRISVSAVIVSLLVWSLCLMIHMYILEIRNSWYVYLIGAALQLLIVFWYALQYIRHKRKIIESKKIN